MGMTALWWWIDRWRKSTAFMDMTAAEQGIYRNLLDEAALRGGALPDDPKMLEKASGDRKAWAKSKRKVMQKFIKNSDGCWHNSTLDSVLHESARRAEKQRQYRLRLGNGHGNGVGNKAGNKGGSPSPSPSLSRKKKSRNRICPHTPRCATWTECTSLILEEGRRTKAHS